MQKSIESEYILALVCVLDKPSNPCNYLEGTNVINDFQFRESNSKTFHLKIVQNCSTSPSNFICCKSVQVSNLFTSRIGIYSC